MGHIVIDEQRYQSLKQRARTLGISEDELVRRAIDVLLVEPILELKASCRVTRIAEFFATSRVLAESGVGASRSDCLAPRSTANARRGGRRPNEHARSRTSRDWLAGDVIARWMRYGASVASFVTPAQNARKLSDWFRSGSSSGPMRRAPSRF